MAENTQEWMENPKNEDQEAEQHRSTVVPFLLGRVKRLGTARQRVAYLEQVLRTAWLHANTNPKNTLYAADVARKIVHDIHVIQLQGEEAREAQERMQQIEERLQELVHRQEELRRSRRQ